MNIAFIQTGGTIDKDYPHHKDGWAFEIGDPAFSSILYHSQHQHQISFHMACKKDSLEINDEDRKQIRQLCMDVEEKAIIITHGSDTLLITADYLKNVPGKTIIITASMLPEKF